MRRMGHTWHMGHMGAHGDHGDHGGLTSLHDGMDLLTEHLLPQPRVVLDAEVAQLRSTGAMRAGRCPHTPCTHADVMSLMVGIDRSMRFWRRRSEPDVGSEEHKQARQRGDGENCEYGRDKAASAAAPPRGIH